MKKLWRYYKKYGFMQLFRKLKSMIVRPMDNGNSNRRQIFIVTPKLDQSGSAIFLYGVLKDFRKQYPDHNLVVLAESFDNSATELLDKLNIKSKTFSPDQDNELFMKELNIKKEDYVFLNSIALQPNIRDYFLKYLLNRNISKIQWYIHEDLPEVQLADEHFYKKFKQACEKNLLKLYAPSQNVAKNYQEFLNYPVIAKPYRLEIPSQLKVDRTENDFNKINFIVVGNANDGRKGQIAIISAIQIFYWRYFINNKNKYRDFEITFVGLHDDFVTQNLNDIANYELKNKINIIGRRLRSEVLDLIKKSNMTITYSYMEALPISTFEGMSAGHPMIRNKVSGVEEQFKDNGFLVENNNLESLINAIESSLNKEKTSNKQLLNFGVKSRIISEGFTNNYYNFFENNKN